MTDEPKGESDTDDVIATDNGGRRRRRRRSSVEATNENQLGPSTPPASVPPLNEIAEEVDTAADEDQTTFRATTSRLSTRSRRTIADEDMLDVADPTTGGQVRLGVEHLPLSNIDQTVYVQEDDRFTAMDRAAMQARIIELQTALGQRKTNDAGLPSTTVDVGESMALGLKAETFIYRIMFVLQGLLSGSSIVHFLFILLYCYAETDADLTPGAADADVDTAYLEHFLGRYAAMALPWRAVEYAALTLVCVMTFDRFDPYHEPLRAIKRALTLQSGGFSILLNLIALGACLACLPLEHKITLAYSELSLTETVDNFNDYESAFQSTTVVEPITIAHWELQLWQIALGIRAVVVSLAWLMVAVRPNTHLLAKHMEHAITSFQEELDAVATRPVKEVQH